MIHTDKPCILGKGDVAALVGKLDSMYLDAVHLDHRFRHDGKELLYRLSNAALECKRILAHAQAPDYTAGVE